MKAAATIAGYSSDAPDSCSQEIAAGQGFEDPTVSNAKCFHAAEGYEDFPIEDVETTVPERFEKIVRMYPDRLAVKMGQRSLTYVELNRAANRIAHAILSRRGPGREPVALMLDHGIDVIAAIFGVLKAGKFYVALDPILPSERIRYVLGNSRASLIVTNNVNRELASNVAGVADQLQLDVGVTGPSSNSDGFGFSGSPNDAAIVHYTSGSTSQPKGVVQSHRFLLHTASTYINQCSTCCHDRFTLLHSVSFASASVHLFRSLLTGAALFPFDIKSQGISRLSTWLEKEQITLCHLPPSAFRQLAESRAKLENLSNLRAIQLSGAPITPADFDLYKRQCVGRTFFSFHMGSTETGVISSTTVGRNFRFPSKGFPIGYVRSGTRIVLLDDTGTEITVPNEVGEIAVRSRYLASGYWGRPDLTSAKFLPDLSGGDERVFLTGDLGRMLPDGLYIHMGRKDFMVKIRGYRVELGEIESALRDHPKIAEVVTAAWDFEPGEKYLTAYIVPRHGGSVPIDELRQFLKSKLPDYMIPSSFVFLESIPLTNGKPNRAALPKPGNERPDLSHELTSPRTEVEQKLAKIWADVLGVEHVGIRDDFFDLGGHSLLASKLISRIEKIFGKELSPTTLLYARTIEQLADMLREQIKSEPASLLVPLQSKGTKPPFFWAGGYASDIHLGRLLGQDQPLYGLLNQCHDGHRPLYSRLEDIAAHHLKEIRAVQSEGPYHLGGFCFGGMVAFEMAQQLKRQGHEVALLFLLDLGTLVNVKALTDRLANAPIRLSKTESFRDELSRHVSALVKLTLRKKFAYVGERLLDRTQALVSMAQNVGNELYYRACLLTGRPIPPSLQLEYHIVRVDGQVMRVYKPQPYTSRMIHIKAEASDYNPQLVAMLSTGQLETRKLICNHGELVREPHISIWAEWLKHSLQTVQTP